MVPNQTHTMPTATTFFYSTGDVVFVASDANSGQMMIYQLQENIVASTKKARATLFEADPFNPLIFTEGGVVEVNVKEISGSLEEIVAGDSKLELTEDEFLRYHSRMIECVDAVTIEEAREVRERQDIDQESAADMSDSRPRRARKRPHTDDFVYYD